ncbi:MAG: hypothetical protein JW394_0190 [Nitrospira sp.]|nr:hypothetical protein [Nitrospira sp.]
MGGDGRGQRAASAVRVGSVDELSLEHIEEPAVIEQVGSPFRQQMAALDQHIFAAESVDDFGGAARVGERFDFKAGQLLRLMDVRRDEQRQREKLLFHGVDRFRLEQGLAGLRDHHRVYDEIRDILGPQEFRDGLNNRHRGKHASLYCGDVEILEDRINLRRDDRGRQLKDVGDLFRILRGDGGNHRHGKDAVGRHGFDIGLDARASTGIGAGNGQDLFDRCCVHGPINCTVTGWFRWGVILV